MSWERIYYKPTEDNMFSFFVIFEEFGNEVNISSSKFNFDSLPENTDIAKYHNGVSPDYRDGFKSGYLWNKLSEDNPALARSVESSTSCMVIRTEIRDQETLDYLRNLVGLVTYFVDNGGLCVYEPQRFKWWHPSEWRDNVFIPKEPKPYQHTQVFVSEQDNGKLWYHTRGLRLFARPDISVHNVTDETSANVLEMINRFIEYQALGGVIENGNSINMSGLPSSMWCEHNGGYDDDEFNNRHVEVHWE